MKDGAGAADGAGWGAEEDEEEEVAETADEEGTRAGVVLGIGRRAPVSGVRDGAVIGGVGRG